MLLPRTAVIGTGGRAGYDVPGWPAAPIPVPPGPERVAYYQARYAAGYALQTAGDAQSDT